MKNENEEDNTDIFSRKVFEKPITMGIPIIIFSILLKNG